MKFYINLFVGIFFSVFGSAQRIVDHVIYDDIDEYNVKKFENTEKFKMLELYTCTSSHYNKDSCIHYCTQTYDSAGNLIALIKGDNLGKGLIDYIVSYRKISDSLFESIVKYPPNSPMIPGDLFTDSIIGKKSKRISLYKKDANNYIVMRSVYHVNGNYLIIERFDIDNKLIHVFYPSGQIRPKKEWTDSIVNEAEKVVIHHELYESEIYRTTEKFDKNDKLIETSTWSSGYNYEKNRLLRKIPVYDTSGNLSIRITVDGHGQFVSEERYYYSGSNLLHYTLDYDLAEDGLNEENIFDNKGRLVLSSSRPNYSKMETTWKYFYNDDGLKEKAELYKNGQLHGNRFYIYKK